MLTIAPPGQAGPGRFCWLDLAASDAASARAFYAGMFGWTARDQPANGGHFTRLRKAGEDIGSLYQMSRTLLEGGVSSHWTPYIRVGDVDEAARQAAVFGGTVIVHPFAVAGVARIAVVLDSVGAQVGLWEPLGVSLGGDPGADR